MGQQISAAAESVGSGASGLPYSSSGMGLASDPGGVASQSALSQDLGAGEGSSHSHQQLQRKSSWGKGGGVTTFDSSRTLPPLPHSVMPSSASNSSPQDPAGSRGSAAGGEQGNAAQGASSSPATGPAAPSDYMGALSCLTRPEMDLGKMSIREAIDSYIEKCLHTTNDGGGSDNESSSEEASQSKTSAGNIFAIDNMAKKSPSSSSSQSPVPSKGEKESRKDKLKAPQRESRASRDSGSSPSPTATDLSGRQSRQPDKPSTDRRDSNAAANKDAKGDDSKGAFAGESAIKIGSGSGEADDNVLVIDCDSEDKEEVKNPKGKDVPAASGAERSPVSGGGKQDGESKAEQSKDESEVSSPPGSKAKSGDVSSTLTENSENRELSENVDKVGGQSSVVKSSPNQQPRGNLLMWELSKKSGAQSSSPGSEAKPVRQAPFFPGPYHLPAIIDRVLNSSLNDSFDDSPPPENSKSAEEKADKDKKTPPSKDADSNVEVVNVDDEPSPREVSDSKAKNEKSEEEKLRGQMSRTKVVPLCIKEHIEKVLVESFFSYEEEEERKEAAKKGSSSAPSVTREDSKGREGGDALLRLCKRVASPKRSSGSTISVQDIVDRVITQTEAINKNLSSPAASDGRGANQGDGRFSSAENSSGSAAATSAGRGHHPPSSGGDVRHSHDKALQEAQRTVVLKEHQSSTTTGRKRGRPRRVSPSNSNNSSSSSSSKHPHHSSNPVPPEPKSQLAAAYADNRMGEYRMGALPPGHHPYPDERARPSHLPPHGGPPPLDYNPHGSLSYGFPPGVSALLPPPPGSASLLRQHQMEQQRHQQAKDLAAHGHAVHSSPPNPGTYPPPARPHPLQDGGPPLPHHLDHHHHAKSHLPAPHHQQQHTGSANSGGGGGSAGSIKPPPPPLILAESLSPHGASSTRLVPVSHIPTKSCSCHSCVAHFSGPLPPTAEKSGSPATHHARLVQQQQQQQQQSLRVGSSGGGGSRETNRSPHHAPHLPHPAYGSAPYPASSSSSSSTPSSPASSRRPQSTKDYYNQQQQQQQQAKGGEALRPVVSLSGRGLPPQAIMPSYVAAQRQQQLQQREMSSHAQDIPPSSSSSSSSTSSAQSPHQPHTYPRESSHHHRGYYDSKSPSSSSALPGVSYQQYAHHPHHPQHQQQHSPASSHLAKPEHRGHPDHESVRHPDYRSSSSSSSSANDPGPHRYDSRSQRGLPPAQPSPRVAQAVPPPSNAPLAARHPPPQPVVDSDLDAPLDLSVKPAKKEPQPPQQQEGRAPEAGRHRAASSAAAYSDSHSHDSRASYRRPSAEVSDGRAGASYNRHPGENVDPHTALATSQQSHYLQSLENSVDRFLPQPQHHRSSYPTPQQQQQQHHSGQHLPHPHHHLRGASTSPHQAPPRPEDHHHHHQPARSPLHSEQQAGVAADRSASYSGTSSSSSSSRAQQSPVQQRGYPHQLHHPGSGSNPPRPGLYPHYPLASTSPSASQHHHGQHPHPSQPPQTQQQHYPTPPPPPQQQQQHHRSGGGSSSSISGGGPAPQHPPQQQQPHYYSRSPVLGKPRAVSPAIHPQHRVFNSSPHPQQPGYLQGSFPAPPQSSSPYQRPPSHSHEGGGDNPRPSSVSSHSLGGPPLLARGSSDTPSPDEDDLDSQGKLNVHKHEPIQTIIGNHSAGDILYLICRLCRQTYGNPYGFRKHFRKEHGFEPKAEHTAVQTISATKNAMAHPGALEQNDQDVKPRQTQADYRSQQHYTAQHVQTKQEDPASSGPRDSRSSGGYYPPDEHISNGPPSKRSEVTEDLKRLECPECSQTFQLNDFGSFKRHCRQHSVNRVGSGSGTGPFLCHDCQRGFTEFGAFLEHLNTHVAFPLSVCGICRTSFSAPDYLAEHLKAAHGHTGGHTSAGQDHTSSAWVKGDHSSGASEDQKPGPFLTSSGGEDGVHPHKSHAHNHILPHASTVMGKSGQQPPTSASSPSSSSSIPSHPPPSKRLLPDSSDPQHAVVHTPRGLQVEKLPADATVMSASPDSSYSEEKLQADSQPGSTANIASVPPSLAKAGLNTSVYPAADPSLKQAERDSKSPSYKSRERPSSRHRESPLPKQNTDSSKQSHSPALASQQAGLPSSKLAGLLSESSRPGAAAAAREDSESVSSDRCASVESNTLSLEGSRTSSPGAEEPEFFYKHKKYSRYNRKRSTDASLASDPAAKSARSSSSESNTAASSSKTTTTTTPNATATTSSSSLSTSLTSAEKRDQNRSPVVTSSASNIRDCESSGAVSEDSNSTPSPSGSNKRVTSSGSSKKGGGGVEGGDSASRKKFSSSSSSSSSGSDDQQVSKDKGSKDGGKKRKMEDSGSASDDKSSGKRWSGGGAGASDSSSEASKFKWERMTRSQVGKASQSVSYSSSN